MIPENTKPMYKLTPIISFDDSKLSLPTCMYRVENIHGRSVCSNVTTCDLIEETNSVIIQQKPSEITKMIEERQKKLLQQLENLRIQMLTMKQNMLSTSHQSSLQCTRPSEDSNLLKDVVIQADPKNPPSYLLTLRKYCNMKITCHTHSSVVNLPNDCVEFVKKVQTGNSSQCDVNIVLIWKPVGVGTKLITSSAMSVVICGDVNILRYLSSVIVNDLSYQHLESSWEIDSILDICHKLQWCESVKEKQQTIGQFGTLLGKNQWLNGGSNHTLGDIAAWYVIKQSARTNELSGNVKAWFQKCEKTF